MRTLAALLFIAGVGGAAIWLARKPTIASGRVMEAELMALVRDKGVVGLACDDRIPVHRSGAEFRCVATLQGGGQQMLICQLDREGRLTAKAAPMLSPAMGHHADPSNPSSGDPWGNRP